jgi:uncharacterized membrane protein
MTQNHLYRVVRQAAVVAALAALGGLRARAVFARSLPAPLTVIYAEYPDEKAGDRALRTLKAAARQGTIALESHALVHRSDDGQVRVEDQRRRQTLGGTVVGGIIGLIGDPAVAAGVGPATGQLLGAGVERDTLRQIEASLEPGESAVIAVVQERWAAATRKALQSAQAHKLLTDDLHALPPPAQQPPPPTPPSP